jgi:hypothetical protein
MAKIKTEKQYKATCQRIEEKDVDKKALLPCYYKQ